MKSEAEIRQEWEVMKGLAENAPRNSDAEHEWELRADSLAWVLEEDDA